MTKIVKITVEGGVVQHVDVPEGVRVIVHDYDVDGMDEDDLEKDADGYGFVATTWESAAPVEHLNPKG